MSTAANNSSQASGTAPTNATPKSSKKKDEIIQVQEGISRCLDDLIEAIILFKPTPEKTDKLESFEYRINDLSFPRTMDYLL